MGTLHLYVVVDGDLNELLEQVHPVPPEHQEGRFEDCHVPVLHAEHTHVLDLPLFV